MPHNSDHIPSIAAEIWKGAPQETMWDMYINHVDIDEAAQNYVQSKTAELESQLGPVGGMTDTDMDTIADLYGMTKADMEDLDMNVAMNLPITDSPVEKAAYQKDQMNKAAVELMQAGFTRDEALARASAVVNNPQGSTPWGQPITLEEVQAVSQVFPGIEQIGNPNTDDATALLSAASKLGYEFDETVDVALQAQEENSFMGSAWDFIKDAGNEIGNAVGNSLEQKLALPLAGLAQLADITATPVYAATTDMGIPEDDDTDEFYGGRSGEGYWDTLKEAFTDAKDFVGDQFFNIGKNIAVSSAFEGMGAEQVLTSGISPIGPQTIDALAAEELRRDKMNYLESAIKDGTIHAVLEDATNFLPDGNLAPVMTVADAEAFIDTQPLSAQASLRSALGSAVSDMDALKKAPTTDTSSQAILGGQDFTVDQLAQGAGGGFPTSEMIDTEGLDADWTGSLEQQADQVRELMDEGFRKEHVEYLMSEGIDASSMEGALLMNIMRSNPSLTVEQALAELQGYGDMPMAGTADFGTPPTIDHRTGMPIVSTAGTAAGTGAGTQTGTPADKPVPTPGQFSMWRDRIDELDVRYGDIFRNLYNKMPGTFTAGGQDILPDLFRDAEIGYYLERPLSSRDWDPLAEEKVGAQTGEAAALEDSYWSDYLQNEFFGDPGSFYDRLKLNAESLRDRMWGYKDISWDEMQNMWQQGIGTVIPGAIPTTAAEGATDFDMDRLNDDIQDRLVFMDPDDQYSRNRMSSLAALYNTPRGSDSWFRKKLQGFFSDMYTNWTAAGNTPEDFLRVFIHGGDQPEGMA